MGKAQRQLRSIPVNQIPVDFHSILVLVDMSRIYFFALVRESIEAILSNPKL